MAVWRARRGKEFLHVNLAGLSEKGHRQTTTSPRLMDAMEEEATADSVFYANAAFVISSDERRKLRDERQGHGRLSIVHYGRLSLNAPTDGEGPWNYRASAN